MTDLQHDSAYFLELQTQTRWGAMLRNFATWLDPKPASRLLDVGCGPGLLPAILSQSGCRTIGIDTSFAMFRDALHPNLLLADVTALPFPPSSFDLITASNLLFLLPNPKTVLKKTTRFLTPNGEIALLNPSEKMSISTATALANDRNLEGLARETLLNYAARAERHYRWSESDLRKLFASANLKLTATTTKMGKGLVRFARGKSQGSL